MGGEKKGLAIASLVLGIVGIPTLWVFLGFRASAPFWTTMSAGAVTGIVLGIIALTRANREPHLYGGKGIAIGGIVTNVAALAIIGIIAVMAIPGFSHSRVPMNEARAIDDIRSVISAEMVYSVPNQGFFDSLKCLAAPAGCIPGYPSTGPVFLDQWLASATTQSGYERIFRPGPQAQVDPEKAGLVSPSSLMSFAYVAVPMNQGVTGRRSFCGDSTGRVCALRDGNMPEVINGVCSASCPDLQ